MWNGKYHMVIFGRKQLLFTVFYPQLLIDALTTRTMTISAAVLYSVYCHNHHRPAPNRPVWMSDTLIVHQEPFADAGLDLFYASGKKETTL